MSGTLTRIRALRERALGVLGRLEGPALLLGRLAMGLLFLSTGWGKVHNIAKVTAFFTELGIPMPGLNAVVVGYSELICGTALVLGLFTRLSTIPLLVSMVVATLTAKLPDIHGVFDLVGTEEFTYLVLLVLIAVFGPGNIAVDAILAKKIEDAR